MKKIISALLILTMICSMVCVSASAAGNVYINMNCSSEEDFLRDFTAGDFYMADGLLFGYESAKALQSSYEMNDELGVFANTLNTWLTYDTSVTLAMGEDTSVTDSSGGSVSLIYCNDNVYFNTGASLGDEEDRIMMNFTYSFTDQQFTFAWGGQGATDEESWLCDPVPMELDGTGATEYTMGMSVEKGRIRCFLDNELIFDYVDSANTFMIADAINSPFLLWNWNRLVMISNITVADHGVLFPTTEPGPDVTTTAGGDVTTNTNGGNVVTTAPVETTTRIENVDVTDASGNAVTDESGNKVTETVIVTDAPVADTNTNGTAGGNATATGDATFIVVVAMVAALGAALIVKKVSVK